MVEVTQEDHARGCDGRNYTCTCGFDDQQEARVAQAYQRGKIEGARLAVEAETRFYIDCEFDGHNGPLLSLAIVRDDDYSIHMRIAQEAKDPWVRKNVMPLMDQHKATQSGIVYINDVGGVIRAFIGDCSCPVIIADSPVDIARFCRALSTGPDGEWASADYPAMRFEVHNVNCYPTDLPGAVQHNAWWDAIALRRALSPAEIVGEG